MEVEVINMSRKMDTEVKNLKLNITLNKELVQRIDSYAEKSYMSRSGFISLACTQYLNAQELTYAISEMSLAMKKIADTGTVDDETRTKMEDFERLVSLITTK